MLKVPIMRQPHDMACLPTCIRAVLAYHGYAISDDEAATVCRSGRGGAAAELAVDGLVEWGLDAELRQFDNVGDLGDAVEDGQPVVAILQHPAGGTHAVVVCEVAADTVTVMDPDLGDYVQLPTRRFEALWRPVQGDALLVGRAPQRP